jgi:hypothetical protein
MSSPALRQFLRRLRGAVQRAAYRLHDSLLPTLGSGGTANGALARLIASVPQVQLTAATRAAVELMVEHRFDLLGSGWAQIHPGMRCRGFDGVRYDAAKGGAINRANRSASARIAALLSPNYRRIDWQIDFRSGYRWSELTWYRDIAYGRLPGVDVKCPWELSRQQHLPELAWAHAAQGAQIGARLATEFRDQVLDWIAHNPPRFGVNWACTMDVGIRAVNWLLAYDLLRVGGARFDAPFQDAFHASLLAHGEHIVRNLEWAETRRANHYLGNIAGLVWLAAYLPADERSDAWLLFAIQELEAESAHQFLPDGAHFEASTSYHRLCAEMLAVCAALLAAVPRARFDGLLARPLPSLRHGPGIDPATPARLRANLHSHGRVLSKQFHARLRAAAVFTRELSRGDGGVAAIGDDDSGRLLRFAGWEQGGTVAECRARFANLEGFDELPDDAPYPLQAASTHQQWLAWEGAVNGTREALLDACESHWSAHYALAASLAGPQSPSFPDMALAPPPEPPLRPMDFPEADPVVVTERREFPGPSLLENLRCASFPWFGLYVMRGPRIHLVIRCGDAMRDRAGVHAHDDQLSFELFVDGRAVTRDPGTYVYTADVATRIRYREATAHAAPAAVGEASPGAFRGAFSPPNFTYGQCREFGAGIFEGSASVAGGAVMRCLVIGADHITVRDVYRLRAGWKPANSRVFGSARPIAYSPGYGVRLREGSQ